MFITKKMTVDGYIKRVRDTFKKGTVLESILKGSSKDSIDELRECNSEFLKAAVDYINLAQIRAKQGYIPEQYGLNTDSTEERKMLNKTFTVDSEVKRKIFYPEWYDTAFENCTYQLLEAVFDASLILEQSAERRFRELWGLYNSLVEVKDELGNTNYFSTYCDYILYISVTEGVIYRLNDALVKAVKKYGIEDFKVYRNLEFGTDDVKLIIKGFGEFNLIENGIRHRMVPCDMVKYNKRDYLQIVLKEKVDTEHPRVQFNVHLVLILAKFQLNTAKHLLMKDSLISVDHLNMNPKNNTFSNMQLITRRDNKLRAVSKDERVRKAVYGYSLDYFFTHIENCFKMDKKDIKFKVDYLKEYWDEKLLSSTAEELLLTA